MLDLASLIGSILGLGAILGGQVLEGGHIGQLLQGTAALIVLGGTMGAMLLSFPPGDVARAFRMIPSIYLDGEVDVRPVIEEIVRVATVARKDGVLAIESLRQSVRDPLFKKCLKFVIDGFDPGTVREIIDAEIERELDADEQAGKVFEAAGGYAPTIGILGAVLGLIHVMSMLSEPAKIGEGIAVAFVATLYGVAAANLFLIPWGTKLKRKAHQRSVSKEVVKLGIAGIQEGLNPHFLQERLEVYLVRKKER